MGETQDPLRSEGACRTCVSRLQFVLCFPIVFTTKDIRSQREAKAKAREEGDCDDEDGTSIIISSVASSEKIVRRTESERLAYLKADVNAETIEVNKVLCRICHAWIKLSTKSNYELSHWNTHQRRCSGAVYVYFECALNVSHTENVTAGPASASPQPRGRSN